MKMVNLLQEPPHTLKTGPQLSVRSSGKFTYSEIILGSHVLHWWWSAVFINPKVSCHLSWNCRAFYALVWMFLWWETVFSMRWCHRCLISSLAKAHYLQYMGNVQTLRTQCSFLQISETGLTSHPLVFISGTSSWGEVPRRTCYGFGHHPW